MLQPGQFDIATPGGVWTQVSPNTARGSAIAEEGRNPRIKMLVDTDVGGLAGGVTNVSPPPGRVGFRGYRWNASPEGRSIGPFREGHASTPFRARVAAESMARRMSGERDLRTGRTHTPPPGETYESWNYGWR